MGCDKCGAPMPLITIVEGQLPLRVFECSPCARGIIVAGREAA